MMAEHREKLSSLEKYFSVFHGVFSVYLTNRCNIACAHCGVSSGPKENSRLDCSPVAAAIREGAKGGKLKAVHVGGGEPFLFPDDLLEIGLAARESDLLLGITTNAFWAKHEATAQRVLKAIPGLTNLFVSTDSYHQKFIGIETVITAIRIAREMALDVHVYACGPVASVAQIRGGLAQQLAPWIDDDRIHVGIVEAVGRGATLYDAVRHKPANVPPSRPCGQLNRPVVVEDGVVLACCNTTIRSRVSPRSPLILGSLEQGLATIAANAEADPYIRAMRLVGPKFIFDRLPRAVAETLGGILEDDICSACEAFNRNDAILRQIKTSLGDPRVRSELDAIDSWLSSDRGN